MTNLFANNYINRLTTLLLLIIIAFLGYLLFLLYYPYRIVEWNIPYSLIMNKDKKVKIGESLLFYYDVCKYINLPVEASFFLINDFSFYYGSTISNLPVGCHKRTISSIVIPLTIKPGKYKLVISVKYKPNFLREIIDRKETEEFEVVP